MSEGRAGLGARIRRTVIVVALVACGADALTRAAGTSAIDPPRVEALAALPVRADTPDPPFRVPTPTYAPIPHVSPIVTTPPTPTSTIAPPVASIPAAAPTSVASSPATTGDPTDGPTVASLPPADVARVKGATILVWNDRADRSPSVALYGVTEFGNPRVFLATALAGDWVQVMLPTRPNGATGWVRAADVDVTTVEDRIDVDLAARTLTWTRSGAVVLETEAGVGAASTPTPTGTFSVTDVLPFDPAAGRGRWVIALNAHSDAYTTFEGGDARIAIHGTSAPSSIGQAVSNGCVRVGAEALEQLRTSVPLGTPVIIH